MVEFYVVQKRQWTFIAQLSNFGTFSRELNKKKSTLKPHDPAIGEFGVVYKSRSTDFQALKLWKVRSGDDNFYPSKKNRNVL